jgi:hypothetical protein
MRHVVLLGDSIFDNGAYVGGGPDVVAQLRKRLPSGWRATLCAVDGAVAGDVPRQLVNIPEDASHLIVSVGGNDALGCSPVLNEPARSMAEAVSRLAEIQAAFSREYRNAVNALVSRGLTTALCTIYDANFPDPLRRKLAVTSLAIFNDVITREAFGRGFPLIDLRLICNEPGDYANPIEPSVRGGEKISAAIASLVLSRDFWGRSEVFAG